MTDIDVSSYNIPPNASFINITIGEIRTRLQQFLKDNYNITVDVSNLILFPYKLCDIRPVYHILFKTELAHLSENDYIGWGDCDLIYGKLSNFVNMTLNYDVIGFNGHFTVFKNTDLLRNLFKSIPDLHILFLLVNYSMVDEKAYRNVLFQLETNKIINIFNMTQVFCDIQPWQWMPNRIKELTMEGKPTEIIDHILFDKVKQTLTAVYRKGDISKEVSYAHLQKRAMTMGFKIYDTVFYIKKESFELTR